METSTEFTYIADSYVEGLGKDGYRLSSIMQWLWGHRTLMSHDSVKQLWDLASIDISAIV